jgi:hypothetical protein
LDPQRIGYAVALARRDSVLAVFVEKKFSVRNFFLTLSWRLGPSFVKGVQANRRLNGVNILYRH